MNHIPHPTRWHRCALGAGLVAALFALAGCNTTEARIQEKPEVFAQLSPTLKDAVKSGKVGLGFTREMTYIALGKPNLVVSSGDGREIAWTYMNYNTPEAEAVLQNKHAISSDIMGSKLLVLDIKAGGKNDRPEHTTLGSDGSVGPDEGGLGWHTVAGKADMDRGEVGIPDPTVRQKTAMERVATVERQDLVISFQDGRIVNFDFVQN